MTNSEKIKASATLPDDELLPDEDADGTVIYVVKPSAWNRVALTFQQYSDRTQNPPDGPQDQGH